MSSQLHRKSK